MVQCLEYAECFLHLLVNSNSIELRCLDTVADAIENEPFEKENFSVRGNDFCASCSI